MSREVQAQDAVQGRGNVSDSPESTEAWRITEVTGVAHYPSSTRPSSTTITSSGF